MRIAALDIGGTSIKSGLWENGSLTGLKEQDTRAKEGGAALIARAAAILEEYLPFDAIGISTAGQVDTKQGRIYYANDNIPGYTGTEVRRLLKERFHVPVSVENDVNAAALGEAHFGAARDCSDFLCLTYGTGVGGAIVLGGSVYTGSTWSAGSFGGIVTHPEDLKAGEEYSGCYEKYASATGLVKLAQELDPELKNGRILFERIEQPQVRQVIDRWIGEILIGLVTLIHSFNPARIVLGGGVMEQPYVMEQIRKRLYPMLSPGFRSVEVLRAGLGNQAGLYGAVYQAQTLLKTES